MAFKTTMYSPNWVYNATVTGIVNGVNTTFTIPENASEVVVYADGLRVNGGGVGNDYAHTNNTIEFEAGRQPFNSIQIDYLPA